MVAVTALGRLIADYQHRFLDRNGVELSYPDIVRRGGNLLSRSRVQQLAKNPVTGMPTPGTLQSLAAGLGAPYSEVVEAALASTGYGYWQLTARPEVEA